MQRFIGVGLAAVLLAGCGSSDDGGSSGGGGVTPAPVGQPWESLAEWNLFDAKGEPAARVVAYDVVSPLWSDATSKHRFVYLPKGAKIGYQVQEIWQFPVGTILVKNFDYLNDARDPSLGVRRLETRLLVHEADGWVPHTYVWNDDATETVRTVAGKDIPVTFIDAAGKSHDLSYGVPNTNQCQECHGLGPMLDTLGGRTRQLNRDHDYGKGAVNQIDHFAELGWLDSAPPPATERPTLSDPSGSASAADRARSYLDANCGHCHAEGRLASSSGLMLDFAKTAPESPTAVFGVCKTPTSAGGGTCGLTYDIVPGNPGESVMMCRIASRAPQVQMPPLATQLVDDTGVQVIGEWIASMAPTPCK
ncbi:MAG: hypothetical protein IPI67_15865 [Myxococcales bacterium]|nr:hypothetical protein [Myxococcales bacterium]